MVNGYLEMKRYIFRSWLLSIEGERAYFLNVTLRKAKLRKAKFLKVRRCWEGAFCRDYEVWNGELCIGEVCSGKVWSGKVWSGLVIGASARCRG